MLTANVVFGKKGKHSTTELENIAEIFLGWLINSGQLCGKYLLVWTKGRWNAYVKMTGPDAMSLDHHSKLASSELNRLKQVFGYEPVVRILDDHAAKKESSWKKTPFLYLFTHAFHWAPPIHRGNNGRYVPAYLLPISDKVRESIAF